ncbi:MAG: D-glycero-alpha-D-manno-heptose-1,7-bisphosphate 7-phosphatase, partial [Candidatus Fonsibacter sp.]
MLDRDGTLIEHVPYLKDIAQVSFKEGVFGALSKIQDLGYTLAIVSNQSAIGRGLASREEVNKVNQFICKEFHKQKIYISAVKICPHTELDKCLCRKPNTLLGEELIRQFSPDTNKVFMVGDQIVDMEFADRLGITAINIENKVDGVNKKYDYVANWNEFEDKIVGNLI